MTDSASSSRSESKPKIRSTWHAVIRRHAAVLLILLPIVPSTIWYNVTWISDTFGSISPCFEHCAKTEGGHDPTAVLAIVDFVVIASTLALVRLALIED